MKRRLSTMLTILVFTLVGFQSGYILGQSPWAPIDLASHLGARSGEDALSPVEEAWALINARYFTQPVNEERLVTGAIEGMLAQLDDPYTRYLSPVHERAERESLAGAYGGIGAEVESVDGNILIVTPIDGTPAAAAGLQPGDVLRAADGVSLSGMALEEAVSLVRGPAGTTIVLTIERDGDTFEVAIERGLIPLVSVSGRLLAEGVAYVRISRFAERTAAELADTLAPLLAESPPGLILDLRRNPGGGLDSVLKIADQFLPAGPVLIEEFGNGRQEQFTATDAGLAEDIPLVVLVDEGSASAAEVLAGAIQSRERGVLVGQSTFGKGTVQTWYSLSNGGGLRVTVARWLTPDEAWINEAGLTPDYVVALSAGEGEEGAADTQLAAAVDFLLGRPVVTTPPDGG